MDQYSLSTPLLTVTRTDTSQYYDTEKLRTVKRKKLIGKRKFGKIKTENRKNSKSKLRSQRLKKIRNLGKTLGHRS